MNMMDPTVPANDLPHQPPAVDVESKATLKQVIVAKRELARLKEYCARLTHDTAKRIVAALDETTERARQHLPRSTYSKKLIEAIYLNTRLMDIIRESE